MIGRYGHISRIANNIDHPPIARIKTFVTLDDPRMRQLLERLPRLGVKVRNLALHIGKRDALVRVHQVTKKEASPGITGFGK